MKCVFKRGSGSLNRHKGLYFGGLHLFSVNISVGVEMARYFCSRSSRGAVSKAVTDFITEQK